MALEFARGGITVLALGASLLMASAAFGEAPTAPAKWEKMGSDDGIEVFRREVPGSPVIAVRGEGVVEAPLARVASVVLDEKRATEWIDSLEAIHIPRMYSKNEFLEYTHIGTPVVMKDRDFVTRGKVDFDPKEGLVTITLRSVEDPLLPATGYVRGELNGYWRLRDVGGGKTLVIAEMHADPKGSVAKWIVNLFQKSWPHNTIESLRKQVAKQDVRVLKVVADALAVPASNPGAAGQAASPAPSAQ